MSEFASTVGFVVIVVLYASVGAMAVLGCIVVTRKLFAPRHEQVFYGLFLVAIAAFYLAFAAYFGAVSSWATESTAVVLFTVLGLAGARLPSALIVGYPMHALWDMLHEWHAHAGAVIIAPEQLTAIPLGYGFFCLTFDIGVAVYVGTRKTTWINDWKAQRSGARQGSAPPPHTRR